MVDRHTDRQTSDKNKWEDKRIIWSFCAKMHYGRQDSPDYFGLVTQITALVVQGHKTNEKFFFKIIKIQIQIQIIMPDFSFKLCFDLPPVWVLHISLLYLPNNPPQASIGTNNPIFILSLSVQALTPV